MSDTIPGKHEAGSGAWYDAPGTQPPTQSQPPAAEAQTTHAQPAEPIPSSVRREQVVCPECGFNQPVTLNRRDSVDFCTRCDYPLFWTPREIQLGEDDNNAEALRRLPGTGGRQTVASVPCPTCAEENTLTAVVCARCHGPMVIAEPAPVTVAAPTVVVEEEPGRPWVLIAVVVLTALLVVALAVAAFNN